MAYEQTFGLSLGVANAGIADLRAQLVDDAGTNVGSAVSTGFVEIGNGFYQWNYASIPDDHRGGAKFYSNAAPSTFLAFAGINPEEAEYTNVKTDTRSSHSAASVRSEMDSNSTQLAAIIVDTGTDIPALIAALNNLSTGDIDARLAAYDAPTKAELDAAQTSIEADIAALNDLSTTQVNAEVDTALSDYDGPTKAEMDSAFTEIKGATWATTDTLEAIRNRGDAAWTTAVGFSTHAAADVWSVGTRTLTSFGTLVADIWAAATSGLTTAGSIGKLLVDNINATISSRSSHDAQGVWEYITRTLTSGGSGGATVAEIWNALTSTMTTDGSIGKLIVAKLGLITGPLPTSTAATADITITRAVTLDGETINNITVPGNWTKCYFTVKDDIRDDADTASVIQIVVTDGGDVGDGLLYLNGVVATAGNGSLSVGADSVTITLHDDATAELVDCKGLDYDVKFLKDDGKSTVAGSGTVDVSLTATRTV